MPFPETQRYRELDLTGAAEALAENVDQVVAHPTIILIPESNAGSLVGGVTHEMLTWLEHHVTHLRQSALGELKSAAHEITIGMGTPGIIIEAEEDKLERRRRDRRLKIHTEFHDGNADKLNELALSEAEYDRMRIQEGGRDALAPNRLIEWCVLFPLILIPEALINFGIFSRSLATDFMALGITIVMGLGIAVAAHLVGSYVKQFNFYMRPDDADQKGKGIRQLCLGLGALIVCLVVIGAFRYYSLEAQAQAALLIGQEPPNIFFRTVSLLFGNIGVFLIGAAFTFMLHDSNPLFTEKSRKRSAAKSVVEKLRNRQVVQQLSELEAALKRDAAEAKSVEQQMTSKPGFKELREQFRQFRAKDSQTIAHLRMYRGTLCHSIQETNPEIVIERHIISAERGGERTTYSVADFSALDIELLCC